MNYSKHVEWFFFALLSGSAGLCVNYMGKLTESMAITSQSIAELNSKMHVVVTKLAYSEDKIHDHEFRLRQVERAKK